MSQIEDQDEPITSNPATGVAHVPTLEPTPKSSGDLVHLSFLIEVSDKGHKSYKNMELGKLLEESTKLSIPKLSFYFQSSDVLGDSKADVLREEINQIFSECVEKDAPGSTSISHYFNASAKASILQHIKDGSEAGRLEISIAELEGAMGDEAAFAPDLILFFGSKRRLGHAHMWQGAYSEFHFVDKPWEAFTAGDLRDIVAMFGDRDRRFGGV
jgi:undecaprenyl pyrophosphate synthase